MLLNKVITMHGEELSQGKRLSRCRDSAGTVAWIDTFQRPVYSRQAPAVVCRLCGGGRRQNTAWESICRNRPGRAECLYGIFFGDPPVCFLRLEQRFWRHVRHFARRRPSAGTVTCSSRALNFFSDLIRLFFFILFNIRAYCGRPKLKRVKRHKNPVVSCVRKSSDVTRRWATRSRIFTTRWGWSWTSVICGCIHGLQLLNLQLMYV